MSFCRCWTKRALCAPSTAGTVVAHPHCIAVQRSVDLSFIPLQSHQIHRPSPSARTPISRATSLAHFVPVRPVMSDNVVVGVRVRPLNPRETAGQGRDARLAWHVGERDVTRVSFIHSAVHLGKRNETLHEPTCVLSSATDLNANRIFRIP